MQATSETSLLTREQGVGGLESATRETEKRVVRSAAQALGG